MLLSRRDQREDLFAFVRAEDLRGRRAARFYRVAWLPAVGDPLCAVAGFLKLPFWPCIAYMAVGKFARYLTMTMLLLWWSPGQFSMP